MCVVVTRFDIFGIYFKPRSRTPPQEVVLVALAPYRVARWLIFKSKIPIWVNFERPWNGNGSYIHLPFGI
jgi:hypothetical protein